MVGSPALSKKTPTISGKINLQYYDLELNSLRLPMSDEEFEAFCYQNPNLHIEQDKHGNIIIMYPGSYDSGRHESEVLIDLGLWNRKTKLGKVFSSSTMFILPDGEKRMPDAAWISNEKHTKLGGWERKKFARVIPDFIVEMRSPSVNLQALRSKMADVWIPAGVRLAWLIDPANETSFIYRPSDQPEEIKGFDKTLSSEDVLPGFEFDLSILRD